MHVMKKGICRMNWANVNASAVDTDDKELFPMNTYALCRCSSDVSAIYQNIRNGLSMWCVIFNICAERRRLCQSTAVKMAAIY